MSLRWPSSIPIPSLFAVGDNVIRVFSGSARNATGGTVNSRETSYGVKLGGPGGHVTKPPLSTSMPRYTQPLTLR